MTADEALRLTVARLGLPATCAYCPFPCPPTDALPTPGGGVAHATCAFEAQRTAYLAGMSDEGGEA